jgi:diacylglycerol kinase family enzyme
MTASEARPSPGRRVAAIGSILIILGVAIATIAIGAADVARLVLEFVLLGMLVGAAWAALTRPGLARTVAIVVGLATLVGLGISLLHAKSNLVINLPARAVALVLAVGLAKIALGTTTKALKAATVPGTPVPPARRGVLFMNLKSGGGKAETFHLVDECRKRGIEPVVLEAGQDWLEVVRDKARSGVDVLGMAGGDGSQAMVGTVAAEFGLPMVVVPAGTRNHLALDLGLDRDDVVGALDAYGDAVERRLDLADVNGHVFVNNVSLGLYAAIVRSPDYRDAKVDTTLSTLPQVLGPSAEPFDLRFVGPDGAHHDGAHIIQVSNNPYGTTAAGAGGRPRLDTGALGIISLVLADAGDPARFLAALATGHPDRYAGFNQWSAPTFEVTSGAPIEIGLDGETQVMDGPLRFSMRPDPVRVRLPTHAPGYSPAARSLGWRRTLRDLWGVALGRPSRFDG